MGRDNNVLQLGRDIDDKGHLVKKGVADEVLCK
jgi:hypothetical protein